MKRIMVLLVSTLLLVTGCGGTGSTAPTGAPKVVTPMTSFDFGNVPVTTDMNGAKLQPFFIGNAGTASLKLSDIQVKTLEGCWPPKVTMSSMVVKPGDKASFVFPFAMHPGMGGKHHFAVVVKTNDPSQPELTFHVYANATENK